MVIIYPTYFVTTCIEVYLDSALYGPCTFRHFRSIKSDFYTTEKYSVLFTLPNTLNYYYNKIEENIKRPFVHPINENQLKSN